MSIYRIVWASFVHMHVVALEKARTEQELRRERRSEREPRKVVIENEKRAGAGVSGEGEHATR